MPFSELDAVIVENIADLQRANDRIDELDVEVFEVIDSISRDWAARNSWIGTFRYAEDALLWLAPANWGIDPDGDEEIAARVKIELAFSLDHPGWNDGQDYFIAGLCGIEGFALGLRLEPTWKIFGRGLRPWKRAARTHAKELSAAGFPLTPNGIAFKPVRIEAEVLAGAMREGAVEEVLEDWWGPILDSLPQLYPPSTPSMPPASATDGNTETRNARNGDTVLSPLFPNGRRNKYSFPLSGQKVVSFSVGWKPSAAGTISSQSIRS